MNQQLSGLDPFLLKTWAECTGSRSALARAREVFIGLELEYEGTDLACIDHDYWKWWSPHNEGSLRGGTEFTLQKPIMLSKLSEALDELMAITEKAKFANSIRTSTHVHVNALNLRLIEIYTFLTAYYLLENLLVHMNGKDREGNLHCLRLTDSTFIASQLANEIRDRDYFSTWSTHHRYAAMNLNAIRKFGSLEFRFLKAYTTKEELTLWVVNLTKILTVTKERFSTPQDVMNYYYATKSKTFLETFFTPDFMELIRRTVEPSLAKQMMAANTSYIYEIISGLTHGGRSKYVTPAIHQSHEDLPVRKGMQQAAATQKKPSLNVEPNWHVAMAPSTAPNVLTFTDDFLSTTLDDD